MKARKRVNICSVFILTILLMAVLTCNIVGSGRNAQEVGTTNLASSTASTAVAFLNENGSFIDNIVKGAQNEYFYFGTNVTSNTANNAGYLNTVHQGAIRWKVLSKNDTRYGDGTSMLLWADYDLGRNNPLYNSATGNGEALAFYSGSLVRALLNGGQYQTSGTAMTNFTGITYIDSIFNTNEISYVKNTSSLITHNYYYQSTGTAYNSITKNIPASHYNVPAILASYATYNSSDGSVTEDTTGDRLFLIDFEDINNVDYGMYDLDSSNNKITYASKFNSAWSGWEDNYYTRQTPSLGLSTTSEYLQSNDLAANYFLRNFATYNSGGTSFVMVVGGNGGVSHHLYSNTPMSSIRPAFLFDPTDILYASANTNALSSTFTQLSSSDDKPAYKLYLKDNFNNNPTKPVLTPNGSSLTVNFTAPTNTHAVLLLSKRDATNHEVEYQADANIVNDRASFTIPSGLDLSDYVVTLMVTSNNGGYSTETVSEQYTYDSVKVTYHRVTPSAGDLKICGTASEAKEVDFGADLATPTGADIPDSNHVFVGWALNKQGTGKIYTKVEGGIPYEADLYAVWKLPDSKITPTITPSDNASLVHTAGSNSAEIEYGFGTLTLTASVSSTIMTDMDFSVKWTKDGAEISGAAQKTYKGIDEVADTGSYSFDYTYKSQGEPLWQGSGSATAMSITVKPGQLTVKSLDVTPDAYLGRPLEETTPVPVMVNSNGDVVTGTARWANVGIIGKTESLIQPDGKERRTFKFTPDNENYGGEQDFQGNFEIKHLELRFILTQKPLISEMEYGQIYSFSKVADMFQSVFEDYYDSIKDDPEIMSSFDGRAPVFVWNDNEIEFSQFKNLTGNVYEKVKESQEITVKFELKSYTVTFDPNNNNENKPWTENDVSYNRFLSKPNNITNGSKMLAGWYYKTVDDNGAEITKKWDFDNDRVTGDLQLTAQWLEADNLVDLTVEIKSGAVFRPGEVLQSGQLIVTAYYTSNLDPTNPVPVELEFSDYTYEIDTRTGKFTISNPDNKKVKVTVTHELKPGNSLSVDIDVPITPNKIDTSSLDFGQDSNNEIKFEYDGTAKNLPTLDPSEYEPLGIENIEYEYYNAREVLIAASDVTRVGTYMVKVKFTTASYNDEADDRWLTLIIGTFTEVRVEWDKSEFMYNGEVQRPTARVFRQNGSEITNINITYSGDTDKSARGKYTIKAVLDGAYRIIEGEEFDYEIVQAEYDIPQSGSIKVAYNGKIQNLEDYLKEFIDINMIEIIGEGKSAKEVGVYSVQLRLKDTDNCKWSDGSTSNKQYKWEIEKSTLILDWDNWEFVYDGTSGFAPRITGIADGLADGDSIDYAGDFIYEIYDADGNLLDVSEVIEMGTYKIVAKPNENLTKNYKIDSISGEWDFIVTDKTGRTVIRIEWEGTEFLYDGEVHYPKYTVTDKDGNEFDESVKSQILSLLNFSEGYRQEKELGTYSVKVTLKNSDDYTILSGSVCKYRIVDENGYAPDEEETKNRKDNDDDKDSFDLSEIGRILKEYWQAIASGICLILLISFTLKGISNISKTKKTKKTIENKYKSYYAAATGLFGLATSIWNVIFGVVAGLTVLSFIFMLITKSKLNKAQEEMDEAKDEYERNRADVEAKRRDENLQMMFMHMMGGGNNGGQGMPQFVQQGLGAEEMRGLISETVTALLPGMQQMLPQQASNNDEVVQKLIEQNEELMQKNERLMQQLVQKPNESSNNDEIIKRLVENQEIMMQKLAEKPTEKVIEKEVVATNANDELVSKLIEQNDKLMQKLAEQSSQPQIIEKVVEKPVEKIVEKVVEKPVVHVISTEASHNVISTEAAGGAEKSQQYEKGSAPEMTDNADKSSVTSTVVERSQRVKEPAPKKAPAPRLTLAEAYAKLTKEQKKFFDGLREYAMKKDSKCKEKLATYFTTIGPSTTNPLIKLTIKKGITVALFKMEDEYLKDIRRNASSDGAKVKVKETEISIPDAQSYDTAKDMIDLRVDQIERYEDYLKEQRAMKRK